jgi:hypothetical protein
MLDKLGLLMRTNFNCHSDRPRAAKASAVAQRAVASEWRKPRLRSG